MQLNCHTRFRRKDVYSLLHCEDTSKYWCQREVAKPCALKASEKRTVKVVVYHARPTAWDYPRPAASMCAGELIALFFHWNAADFSTVFSSSFEFREQATNRGPPNLSLGLFDLSAAADACSITQY